VHNVNRKKTVLIGAAENPTAASNSIHVTFLLAKVVNGKIAGKYPQF